MTTHPINQHIHPKNKNSITNVNVCEPLTANSRAKKLQSRYCRLGEAFVTNTSSAYSRYSSANGDQSRVPKVSFTSARSASTKAAKSPSVIYRGAALALTPGEKTVPSSLGACSFCAIFLRLARTCKFS